MAIFSAIGTAIAGAFFGGSAIIGSAITGVLAFGAQTLLGNYLNRKKERPYSAVSGEVSLGGNIPAEAIFGTAMTKGHRAYYAKAGKGDKYNAEIFILSNGWCDGLEPYIYFYGEKHNLIERAVTGNEVACYGVENYQNDGYDRIVIRFYDGRPGQLADTQLVNVTSGQNNNWKSTSRLSGMCYVVVERTFTSDLFSKGVPEIDFVVRGLKLYDPRKDSTVAGGSGAHRINDPATWEHSLNPVVQRLNYQLGLRGLISQRTIIGEGKTLGQLDLSSYFASMNAADALINDKPTYQCSLIARGDDDHTEILKEFDDAVAGYGLNRRGLSGVLAGAPQIPVATITRDDIPVERQSELRVRKSAFELYNHMSGQFISPEASWTPVSLKPIYVNADLNADGRSRQTGYDFLQVTDPDIAQRLLNIRYRQQRLGGKVTVPISRRLGFVIREGDWVEYDNKEWIVENWLLDEKFEFTLELAETNGDIYDEGTIEPGPIVTPSQPPINPDELSNVQNFAVEVGTVTGSSGTQLPALRFTWDPPDDPTITEVRFQYNPGTEPSLTPYEDVSRFPERGEYITTKNVMQGQRYVARCTISTRPDRFKTFSNWLVTANITEALLATANILDDSITAEKIQDAAITADKLMNEAVTNLKLAADAVTEAKIAVNAVTSTKISDLAITNSKLAALAVDATKLANGAVSATKLADEAVTNAKLGPLAVDAAKLATNAVTETKIADNSISTGKLQANSVVADKIAANSVTARSLVLGDFSNAFLNPSARDNLDGWVTSPSGTDAPLARAEATGIGAPTNYVFRAPFSNASAVVDHWGASNVSVKAGEVWKYQFDYRIGGTVGDAQAYGRYYYRDGTSSPINFGVLNKTTAWGTFSFDLTIPSASPEVEYMIFGVRLVQSTATGFYYFTNFRLRRMASAELIVDGAITAGKISADAVVAGKIAADAVTARELIVADFTNLVPDNQIQEPSVWSYSGGGVFTQDDVYVNGNSFSQGRFVYNSALATGTATLRSRRFPVTANDTLYVSIQVARLNGGTRTGQAAYVFSDENLTPLTSGFFGPGFSGATAGFQNQVGELVVPVGAKFMSIGVNVYNNGTANDFVICGPIARIKSNANLIVDGAITADKLGANSVVAGKIAANAVVADTIAANAVTGAKIAANSVTADKIVANSITARELILTDFANLVPDPHYQVDALWARYFGTVWTPGTPVVQGWGVSSKGALYNNGAQSLTGFAEVIRSTIFAVEDGQSYNITWEQRRYNAGESRCRLVARCFDRELNQLAYVAVPGGQINTSSTIPVKQSTVYTPPAGTVQMIIGVQWDGLNSTSGFIIGYISVRPMRGAELIVDGGITANKLSVNTLSAISANAGTITAGIVRSADSKTVLDLNNGFLSFSD